MSDITAINDGVIAEYRRTGGALSGPFEGTPVLLLTTTGRRSGAPHTNPLGYVEDGDRLVVAGSAAGSTRDPDWFWNLAARPAVTVEVGGSTRPARARILAGDERDTHFARLVAALPGMDEYAASAGREIPVVALQVVDSADHADRLLALHRRSDPLVLTNAWDAASAQLVEAAGASAVATASAAVAAMLGVADERRMPPDLAFEAVARVAAAVTLPVTADLFDGYGLLAEELVDRLLATGAVGCNLEDSDHSRPGHLVNPAVAAGRVGDVRAAAESRGVHVVVNARVDSFLHGGDRDDVLRRARMYLDAGADCVYPIRLTDPDVAGELVAELDGPVNVNLGPGGTVAAMAAAGASRISVGPMGQRTALAAFESYARGLLGPR